MKKNLLILVLTVAMLGQTISSSASFVTKSKDAESVKPDESTAQPSSDEIKAAMEEFKSLSKEAKHEKIKEFKQELKKFKAAKKAGEEPSTNTLLLVILAIFIPPLAVYLHEGVINNRFWISLILTLLGGLPGIIYSIVVVLGPVKGKS